MGEAAVGSDTFWEIRNPDGGAMGLKFALARMAAHDVVLVHAAPSRMHVVVRDEPGARLAEARDLRHEIVAPMSRLTLRDGSIDRENLWPTDEDLGLPVILPGGEVGLLRSWWNAQDRTSWRWQVEFANSV